MVVYPTHGCLPRCQEDRCAEDCVLKLGEMRRYPPGRPANVRQWGIDHPTLCTDYLQDINTCPRRQEHNSQVTSHNQKAITLTTKMSFFHGIIELTNIRWWCPPQLTLFAQVTAPPGYAAAAPQAPLPWFLGHCGLQRIVESNETASH